MKLSPKKRGARPVGQPARRSACARARSAPPPAARAEPRPAPRPDASPDPAPWRGPAPDANLGPAPDARAGPVRTHAPHGAGTAAARRRTPGGALFGGSRSAGPRRAGSRARAGARGAGGRSVPAGLPARPRGAGLPGGGARPGPAAVLAVGVASTPARSGDRPFRGGGGGSPIPAGASPAGPEWFWPGARVAPADLRCRRPRAWEGGGAWGLWGRARARRVC